MSTKTMKPIMIVIAANDYNFGAKWSKGLHVFLPINKTFEAICLAFAGKFLPKEWPGIADFSVFEAILFKLQCNLDPAYTYPDIFESATFSFQMRFPPTARTRSIRHTSPQRFWIRNRVQAKLSSYNIHPCWTTWHSSRVSQFCLWISSPCFKAKWTSEV